MFISRIKRFFTSGDGRTIAVKRNVFASFGIKGVSILISFALVPLTIGYVSAELYGVWLTLSSILAWMSFLDIGLSQGLKNKLTEAIAKNDWERGKSLVSTTYFTMVIIFIPVCILLEALVPFISWSSLLNVDVSYETEIRETLLVLIAMICLQMVVNVLVSVIAAFQKVALSNMFVPIGNVISLVIIFVLTKVYVPSLVALALSLAAMPIVVTTIASIVLYFGKFRKVAPSFSAIKLSYIKSLIGLGWKFFFINIQVVVIYQSTNILISHVSSPNEVTTYNIAYKLMSVAMMIYNIIAAPLWPAYTDAYARNDFEWMKNMRKKMVRILGYSIAGCILIAVLSKYIYLVWIGDRVNVPYAMTAIVCLYVCVFCWSNLNGTIIAAMGKLRVNVIIMSIGLCLHIPLSFFLSSYVGCYGVITSMIVISFFYAVVHHIQVVKLLNKTAKGVWVK